MSAPLTPGPSGTKTPQVTIISHSPLFYWWPVWFFGFVMALWTYIEDHRMVIVTHDATIQKTETETTVTIPGGGPKVAYLDRDVYVDEADKTTRPRPRVTNHPAMGALFVVILFLVIVITNIPLRGLWSLIALISIVVIVLLISLFDKWDTLFSAFGKVHIYSNMAFYLFLCVPLFIAWLVTVTVFDRRTYMIFTPGMVRVCEEVGREKVYDTMGMTVEKHRDDLFRHLVLGFGSGDLTIKTSGADRHEIHMPNVLGIYWKLGAMEKMVREKTVVQGQN